MRTFVASTPLRKDNKSFCVIGTLDDLHIHPPRYFCDGAARSASRRRWCRTQASTRASRSRNSGEYRLRQLVALQQMPECSRWSSRRDSVASELQTCERAHRADVVEHFSAPGSDRLYHCCRRSIRSITADGNGHRRHSGLDSRHRRKVSSNGCKPNMVAIANAPPAPPASAILNVSGMNDGMNQ